MPSNSLILELVWVLQPGCWKISFCGDRELSAHRARAGGVGKPSDCPLCASGGPAAPSTSFQFLPECFGGASWVGEDL